MTYHYVQTITVGFVKPAPGSDAQQRKVKEVVKQWEKVANLKFLFVPTGPQADNANIRVSFQKNAGSWSYVGKAALTIKKPAPTLNLGWVYSTPETGDEERGVILHEFGHAIGYLHEHQSPRRGEKLTLNERGVFPLVSKIMARTHVESFSHHRLLCSYSKPPME